MSARIEAQKPVYAPQALIAWAQQHLGVLLFVALPTLLTALYYFVIAADLYASEANFIVRTPSKMQVSGIAGLLQSTGVGGGREDVYAVQTFATSRDALAMLAKKVDLKAIFNRPEADLLARYPNPIDWDNAEDFHQYFQRRVAVIYDTTTGISTLTVKAFRAEDAQLIANTLLNMSEQLVNRLNQRAHDSAVRSAEVDVKASEDEVAATQQRLLEYRNRESLLDPGKSSSAIFESQAKTEAELQTNRTRLSELKRSAPQSPMLADLQAHIRALEEQLATQRGRLTGGEGAMAPKLSSYEQLSLQKEFVTRKLTSALASLEASRAEARQQQIYLERVVDTSLPDRARYPQRLQAVLIVFISCFMVFSIAKLLISGVREHGQQ